MPRGTLITIEGLDGAGKTTLARSLSEELAARARARRGAGRVELLREPGGVAASERLRALVKDPALSIGAPAEALLYAAARAQLVQERLRPLLDEGALVLLDRFVDSSLAYQGAGRELGIERIRAINTFATGRLRPDCTLLLRIAPATGRARLGGRRARATARAAPVREAPTAAPDRIEGEDEAFFARVAAAYEELARAEPARFRAIDAERAPAEVLADALAALADLPALDGPPGA